MQAFHYEGPACLNAAFNDCTDVTVEFRNTCAAPAVFGDVQIPADGNYEYRKPARRSGGGYILCPREGACPGTDTADETVVLDGTQNGQPIRIQFYVTGYQC